MEKMIDHFTLEEKTCPCGCELNLVDLNQDFLQKLNSARELYGKPMNATSMTRCPAHNKAVGGQPNSAHLDGRAADISCNNMRVRKDMVFAFIMAGFTRIELSPTHIHVDMKVGANDMLSLKIGGKIV